MTRHLSKNNFLSLLVFTVGLAATGGTWHALDRQIQHTEQLRFNRQSERVVILIQERLLDIERLLEGGRGLFYASKSVALNEWSLYANSQRMTLYPGILGFGYIYPVQREKLPDFIAAMRTQAADFNVKSTGNFPDLFVITQIEPVAQNRAAWGFDIGQEAHRREAAETARASGTVTLTRRITLVQDQKKIAGFLMLMPMYKTKAAPATLEERKRLFAGWVYAPIRVEELMSGIVADTENMIDFEVLDGDTPDKQHLIFDADGHLAQHTDQIVGETAFKSRMFHKQTRLEVQNRAWTVFTSTRPEFEQAVAHAYWVIPTGLLLSALAAFAIWSATHARRRAESLAENMTLEVREREERWQLAVSGYDAGIWDWDVRTDVVYYSPRWLSLLGLQPPDIHAKREDWLTRVHAEDIDAVQDHILTHFSHATSFYSAEYRILHNDGSYRWVADTGKAKGDAQGNIIRMVGAMTDITLRKQAESDLRDSEARVHAIVDSVTDAIIVIDRVGGISSINPAAERIFGYSSQEVVGRNVSYLMPEPYRSEHDKYIHHYFSTGEARVMGKARELTGQRKNGEEFPMELAVARMIVKDEIMFTGIVRDITERKKIDRMKAEFVSTVSHELRTPITAIRGSLGLVAGGALGTVPEKMHALIDIAYSNTERLLRLINDILDIEKIESGKLDVVLKNQMLLPLIEQSLVENQAYAEQFGVQYQLVKSGYDVAVNVDAGRLMQIMANLLSNAAKFSPAQDTVTTNLTVQGDRVRIAVSDRGPGIPEAFRDKVFQKFTQADSSDTRKKGGTGLGLAISKVLVEQMHGTIEYETSAQGTCFYFTLPIEDASGLTRQAS